MPFSESASSLSDERSFATYPLLSDVKASDYFYYTASAEKKSRAFLLFPDFRHFAQSVHSPHRADFAESALSPWIS